MNGMCGININMTTRLYHALNDTALTMQHRATPCANISQPFRPMIESSTFYAPDQEAMEDVHRI